MIVIIILSLLLDSLINYYFNIKTLLFISTLIIYLIRNLNKKKTIYLILGSSLIYDLLFSNIYFLYLTIFILIYLIITFIKNRLNKNIITDIFIFMINIILFNILKFTILSLICHNSYSLSFLIDIILESLIINIIYGLIIYYILGIKLRKH